MQRLSPLFEELERNHCARLAVAAKRDPLANKLTSVFAGRMNYRYYSAPKNGTVKRDPVAIAQGQGPVQRGCDAPRRDHWSRILIVQRDIHSPHRKIAIRALANKADRLDGRHRINWLLVALVCALTLGLAYATGVTTTIGSL